MEESRFGSVLPEIRGFSSPQLYYEACALWLNHGKSKDTGEASIKNVWVILFKNIFLLFFLSNLILNDFLVILSSFIMCFFLYILVILVYLNFLVWFFAKDPFSNEFHETDPGGPIETEPSVS